MQLGREAIDTHLEVIAVLDRIVGEPTGSRRRKLLLDP